MPKLSAHILRWSEAHQVYELSTDGRLVERLSSENERSWLRFLETHTSFAFQGREGRLSVVKESRPRGTGYWYAYRSPGGRTVKRYLGQASNVTIAHLEEVAAALTHSTPPVQTTQERKKTFSPPSPPASLLLSKLLPPRLPSSLVERSRLLRQLDAALERKITLLVAPAGFGKTTVINQWMNEHRAHGQALPIAWVSLDSSDNDLFRFWRYIIAACQTFRQDIGQTALAFLSEALQPPFASPPLETALTLLLNDITQKMQRGLLILDDYHVIDTPRIHGTLTFFLDRLPPTLSVLLTTRSEPLHLPLLRWRARGELSELHGADLRFSPEETATFIQQAFPAPLSDATLKQLDTSLQGWVAGLRLLSLTLPGQKTSHALEQALTSLDQYADLCSPYRPLLDYFVTEILNTLPERLQRFLLQTSVLSRLSGPLCAAVTGEENSTAQLEAIAQAGLFLEALDGAGGWYHFHTLFSEAMQREATLRLGEETLRTLSLQASSWYEQHAMVAEAVEAALLAHEFERAASLIERADMDGQSSELHTVRRWLEQTPEAVLHTHPMLCWLAALALQEANSTATAENSRVEALLNMAKEGWHRQGDSASPSLISALRAIGAWKAGLFARAVEHAQQALAQLPDHTQDRRMQTFRDICKFVVGTGYMYEGQFDKARPFFLEAYEGSLSINNRHFTSGTLLLIGACSYAQGELHQAHEYYQQALSAGRRQDDREIIAQALLNLASISFEWNELTIAEQQANEARSLALESEQDLRNGAALQLALLAYARGQITSAQQQVAILQARLQTTTTPEAALRLPDMLIFSAHLALETRDFQAVQRILETSGLQEHTEARILQARLLLAQSKPREASLQLERLLPVVQDPRHAIEIMVLLSLAHAAHQEEHKARQWLQQALSQARPESFMRIFLSEGEPLVRFLRQYAPAIQEKEVRSYAQSILRASAQTNVEQTPGTASSNNVLVEPLSSQELRVLRLLAAGETNQQIAQDLVVSVNTVKDHLKHLYRKLGVNNRLQASQTAHHLKLVSDA